MTNRSGPLPPALSLVALAVPPLFALVLGVRFIPHEERTMTEKFGDAYAAYSRRVRRWI